VVYKTGTWNFNPKNHKELKVVKIIESLSDFEPWNIEEMANADDHLLQGM